MRTARFLIGLIFIGIGVTGIVGTTVSASAAWFAAAGAAAVAVALLGTAWERREVQQTYDRVEPAVSAAANAATKAMDCD